MPQITLTLPDGSEKSFESGITGLDIAKSISEGLARKAIAVKLGEKILDLNRPLTADGAFRIITPSNEDLDALFVLRHSCAHVLAEAVCSLFPGTKLAYGPPVEDGFYYDLASPEPITHADFERIEKKMAEIIKEDRPFTRVEVSLEEALKRTEGDKYKRDNVERAVARGDSIFSFYVTGTVGAAPRGCPCDAAISPYDATPSWEDLCAGPHVPSTGKLKAFKVLSLAGAYWHGDQNSDQLTRVYGTCYADKAGLDAYLKFLEEAKKRDHRRIGQEMDLYHLEDHSPGMVFWHPHGTVLVNVLRDFVRKEITKRGYKEVITPEIVDKSLWVRSGHADKYDANMFKTLAGEREMAVKPMNCPCHIEIFNQGLKSWRDLPLRLSEFGKCHRNEPAGTMHGLMRVRGFVQDDAHIFCTEEQIASEVSDFCTLVKDLYKVFGFEKITVKFSTRPETRVGSDELWDKAEQALEEATKLAGLEYNLNPGEGAFYGPKLEFVLKDSLGRDWQCGTIQVDFNMPARLGAEYVGKDNQKHTPVMLHRAALGSLERFIGILTEEYAGDFPFWLAPMQVRVLPVSEKFSEYAEKVRKELVEADIRAEIDNSNEKVGYKIRQGELAKVPYLLVVGEKEVAANTVSVRKRKEGDLGQKSLEEFLGCVHTHIG
ncbi:MAG: threonine--tRNA ligase [Fibromonadales bacterium]|nr:threonine--tRNA ligase [Fibromonadales bacterium]